MSPTSFVVRGSDTCAEGWADRPLPFEPKGSMLEYRQALRRALAELDPARGAVLRGRYASPDSRRCDVENLLLYNLGLSAFGHLRPQEVVLTRSLTPAPAPEGDPDVLVHHHRYDLVAAEVPAAVGDVIARLAPLPLRRPVALEKVWYEVRSSGGVVVERRPRRLGDQLGLDLTLHRPAGGGQAAMLGMVKVLVDGVVSALHRHDGSQLGTRKLLWPYRELVQWNPADDAIVRLRVRTMPSSTWLLSGTLTDLVRGPVTRPDDHGQRGSRDTPPELL